MATQHYWTVQLELPVRNKPGEYTKHTFTAGSAGFPPDATPEDMNNWVRTMVYPGARNIVSKLVGDDPSAADIPPDNPFQRVIDANNRRFEAQQRVKQQIAAGQGPTSLDEESLAALKMSPQERALAKETLLTMGGLTAEQADDKLDEHDRNVLQQYQPSGGVVVKPSPISESSTPMNTGPDVVGRGPAELQDHPASLSPTPQQNAPQNVGNEQVPRPK